MPECAVCSSPAPHKCARCKCVFYCSPAHQKEDWPVHKVQCPRLAQEAEIAKECLAQKARKVEDLLLRCTAVLAKSGSYHNEVGRLVLLNKEFSEDKNIWDAFKDVPGPGGRTRLMHASHLGLIKRVKRLLARGADVNFATTVAALDDSVYGTRNGRTDKGTTALILAIDRGHLEVVRLLCDRGANVDAARSYDGTTALMGASVKGYLGIVRVLCDKGAGVNICSPSKGYTPLMYASQEGHLGVVTELCARGANVIAARPDGVNPLLLACKKGSLSVFQVICANAMVDVNAVTTDGDTALIKASSCGHMELVRFLLDKVSDVNACNKKGSTSLLCACCFGHVNVVRLLLQNGADKSFSALNGDTAFTAAQGPRKAAIQALLK